MTLREIHKIFSNRYIEVEQEYDFSTHETVYTIVKSYKKIHENTTLGQDLGTPKEYTR